MTPINCITEEDSKGQTMIFWAEARYSVDAPWEPLLVGWSAHTPKRVRFEFPPAIADGDYPFVLHVAGIDGTRCWGGEATVSGAKVTASLVGELPRDQGA